MKSIFASLFLITALTVNSQSYEIYVSDAGNFNTPPWQILKFDGNGQNPSVFINSNLYWPQDILFLEDMNEVLISNLDGCINKHNANTGAYISSFACSISGPTRIKIGPDSLLYVLQWGGNGKVRRYNLTGTYLGEFTSIGVSQSIGLDWDSNGNLYVSSYNGDFVRKFDTAGNDLGIFIDTNLLGPTNIWFDSNGDLLVADYNGTAVKRYDSNGTYLSDFITGLSNCEGVDSFPNGNILIGNGGTSSVKMYDSNGNYIQDLVSSGSGNLLTPNAVRIREVSTVGIDENHALESNIISPNFGTKFRINIQNEENIESCTVTNVSGQLINSFEVESEQVFNMHNESEGIYFVIIRFKNARVKIEKIMVSKYW